MIPFENEPTLTPSEEYAKDLMEANWDHVVRTTSGTLKDIEEKYPKMCEVLSQEIRRDAEKDVSDIFRPGVPDFLAFDDRSNYKFVEVKSGGDGLRSSQLSWLRDFKDVKSEIWFTSGREVEEKLETDNIQAFSFKEKKAERSEQKVLDEEDGNYLIQLPKSLATIIGIQQGEKFRWRLKSKNELVLDIR